MNILMKFNELSFMSKSKHPLRNLELLSQCLNAVREDERLNIINESWICLDLFIECLFQFPIIKGKVGHADIQF